MYLNIFLMSYSLESQKTFLLQRHPTDLCGSVLTPKIGKLLSFIILAVLRNVPSPPSDKTSSSSGSYKSSSSSQQHCFTFISRPLLLTASMISCATVRCTFAASCLYTSNELMTMICSLPSLQEFVLNIAALEKASGLQSLKLCCLFHAQNFIEEGHVLL